MIGPLAPNGLGPLATIQAALTYQKTLMAVSAASLIGYWPLNEASGTTATEVVFGRNGTYIGTISYANVALPGASMGSAPYFNGSDASINTIDAAFIAALSKTTGSLSVWARNHTSGNVTCIWETKAGGDGNNRIGLFKQTDQTFISQYMTSGSGNQKATSIYTVDSWAHLGMTWDTGTNQMKLYLNGVQAGTTGITGSALTGTLDNARIANLAFTNAARFNGWIGHVAVWNTVLSASDMAVLATAK